MRVESNCKIVANAIIKNHPEDEDKFVFALNLIQRGRTHDLSKFNPFEFNNLHHSEKLFEVALKFHHEKNSHHPEFHQGGIHEMEDLDIAEMVCDCAARAQEFGTDVRNWFLDTDLAPAKFKYGPEDEVWNKITYFLDLLLTPKF